MTNFHIVMRKYLICACITKNW